MHVNSLSTSAATSRMNMPLSTTPCPPVPAATIAPTTSSTAMLATCVTQRWRSSRNRSSISSANAAPTSTISGRSGSSSAAVGIVGVMRSCPGSELARRQLAGELGDGGFHQVGQRLRIDAERDDAGGERAEDDLFAQVDVFHLCGVRVADFVEDRALHRVQRG